MNLTLVPLSSRPELQDGFGDDVLNSAWPAFMLEDPIANLYFGYERFERYHEFVIVAFDEDEPDVVLGRGCSVPFYLGADADRPELPDGGWDTVVRWADQDSSVGRAPNAVSALEITLHPRLLGQGYSGRMVAAMKANTARLGFADLYAPVRPSHKHLEPSTPMQEYAWRTRPDGLPSDPWLRVHVRLGGKIVKVAPYSMTIPGTLASWRTWTGLPFEREGDTEVPGALVPVHISLVQNHAVYVEPNVWVRHRLP
jgi:hypothetical protein